MMNWQKRRAGFTLIEMLVASLLLGMLVTILTMVFNSSSIAWRTGKAGISQMSQTRRHLSLAQRSADSLLPRVNPSSKSEVGIVTGAWLADGKLRTRGVAKFPSVSGFALPMFSDYESNKDDELIDPWMQVDGSLSLDKGSSQTYVVGVLSYGPDGKLNTGDDISTWPDEVE